MQPGQSIWAWLLSCSFPIDWKWLLIRSKVANTIIADVLTKFHCSILTFCHNTYHPSIKSKWYSIQASFSHILIHINVTDTDTNRGGEGKGAKYCLVKVLQCYGWDEPLDWMKSKNWILDFFAIVELYVDVFQ